MTHGGFWSRALLGLGAGLMVAAVARGAWRGPGAVGGITGVGGALGGGAVAAGDPVLPAPVVAGPVTMKIGAGSARVLQGSPGEVVLDVELGAADAAPAAAGAARSPTHLSVVIDRSGSMEGDKLEKTKQAVGTLLERLGPKDRVSVIAYDADVSIVVPPTALEETGARARIDEAVRALRAGGATNISGGLEAGAGQVRRARRDGETGRVLLLTDGLPTAGATDPEALTRIARAARESGIGISTFGVGVDYNERLMLAMADAGGGAYAFIQDPGSLGPVFERELLRIARTAARDVRISIDLAPGVELAEVYSWPHERAGAAVSVRVGDIEAGSTRHVTMRLKVPTGAVGALATVSGARIDLRDAGAEDAPRSASTGPLVLACTPDQTLVLASRDAAVVGRSTACSAGSAISLATQRLEAGDRAGARAILASSLVQIRSDPLACASPAGATATASMERFLLRVKTVEAGSYDARCLTKEGWSAGSELSR